MNQFFFLLSTLFSLSSFSHTTLHPDEGEVLCFDYTNFDHGYQYVNDSEIIYFPFTNCSGEDLIIKDIHANDKYASNTYSLYGKYRKDSTIKAGTRDSIAFKRYAYSGMKAGLYDNSWTISFINTDVRQHLNIFCELDYNYGQLEVKPIVVNTVNRGETALFNALVKNTGVDPVTITTKNRWGNTALSVLTPLPKKIEAGETAKINFSLKTDDLLNSYSGSTSFNTNENGNYPSLSVPYSGELISINHPSIKFDSLVLTLNCMKGERGIFDFWFENDGDLPLIISQSKTSCGCLVATWPREPIEPGERGVIKVKYDTKRIGPINKSITVSSNASETRIILRVRGNVKIPPSTLPK
jgi:hypothetical protein